MTFIVRYLQATCIALEIAVTSIHFEFQYTSLQSNIPLIYLIYPPQITALTSNSAVSPM